MSLYLSFDYYRDQLTTWIMHVGMPMVQVYHSATGNLVINSASEDAQGLEKIADVLLAPSQYVMAGKYFQTGDGINYTYRLRFDYNEKYSWAKTGLSFLAMPVSLAVGGTLKAISLLDTKTRLHHDKLVYSLSKAPLDAHQYCYDKVGINFDDISVTEAIEAPQYVRRPGDERTMEIDKLAMKAIIDLFHEHHIAYWLDCGTLLGAQRYGGVIPWDFDLDMAILQLDFDNAYRVLSKLDSSKYVVQDWSSRDRPKSYLKVYVKETGTLIDLYNFAIDEDKMCLRSVLSNENSIFLPESWKIRERRFVIDTPISYVFPLKKATFDGMEAYVPNQTVNYLKQRYGDNIGPAKLFNSVTNRYEKDLSHPYWQMPHAH